MIMRREDDIDIIWQKRLQALLALVRFYGNGLTQRAMLKVRVAAAFTKAGCMRCCCMFALAAKFFGAATDKKEFSLQFIVSGCRQCLFRHVLLCLRAFAGQKWP